MPRLAAILFLLLAACGGDAPPAVPDAAAPLEALPDCSEPPAPIAEAPEGFIAPEGVVIQAVVPQKPLTNVTAYIAATPGKVRQEYEKLDGVKVLISEDEVFEAELLVSDGDHRTYAKVTAVCREGSNMLAVVAPELEAGALPTPRGTPPPLPLPTP